MHNIQKVKTLHLKLFIGNSLLCIRVRFYFQTTNNTRGGKSVIARKFLTGFTCALSLSKDKKGKMNCHVLLNSHIHVARVLIILLLGASFCSGSSGICYYCDCLIVCLLIFFFCFVLLFVVRVVRIDVLMS